MRTLAIVAATFLVLEATAFADCPSDTAYHITTNKTGDAILVTAPGVRCDGARSLVRQNVHTGEAALVVECDEQGDWLDRCAESGVFRYGLAIEEASCECGPVRAFGAQAVNWGVKQCQDPLVDAKDVPWLDGHTLTCGGDRPTEKVAAVDSPTRTAGCSIGGDASPSGWLALGLVMLAVSRRRVSR
jgi:MYXO-CTERM domain-containing protein